MSISLRSAVVLVAIAASAFTATLAAAHDHHDHHHHDDHDGNAWHFFGSWANKQNMSDALKDCLCWNTTSQTWCHSSLDGSNTGFWRDSCQRVVYYNYFWVVFAVLWMIWLAVVPFFTCIFRICCNCCGGRNPSYGCCCPYSNKLMSQDPKFKRPYSRCQTFTAKILALIMLIAFIDLSVHAFVSNHQVSDKAMSGAQALQTSVSALQDTYLSVISLEKTEAFKRLNATSTSSNSWFQVDLSSVESLFNKYNKRVTDVQNGINKFEDHQHEYRSSPTIKLVAVPLAFVVIISILGFCNVRSWPISISAGLISIIGIVFIVAASVTVALGIGMGTVCNHQDTVKNFTKQILTNRGCDMYTVTEQINATEIAFVNTLCKAGLNASSSICSGNNMFTNTSAGFIGVNVVNMTLVEVAINASKKTAPAALALWTNYSSLFKSSSPLATLFRDNYNCNIVDTQFDTVLEPALCQGEVHTSKHGHHTWVSNTVSSALTGLGGLLFGLAIACTFTYWIWLNGAKRFTKSSTKEEILAAHHQFLYPVADGSNDQWTPYQPHVGDIEALEKTAAPAPAPAQPTTPAVAATTEQPLLLSHQAPNYSSSQPSVNNKQQPEPIDQV